MKRRQHGEGPGDRPLLGVSSLPFSTPTPHPPFPSVSASIKRVSTQQASPKSASGEQEEFVHQEESENLSQP